MGAREACGVFGIHSDSGDIAQVTYKALHALQHRGQESAGIALSNGSDVFAYKKMGLVTQVFTPEVLGVLRGRIAIGHVRYSTTGSSVEYNAQPIVVRTPLNPARKEEETKIESPLYGSEASERQESVALAIAHNGNIVNADELRDELAAEGLRPLGSTDSEIMAMHLWFAYAGGGEGALIQKLGRFRGAFSITLLMKDKLMAARDVNGFRPLCLGRLGGDWVVASESCVFPIIRAEFVREIEPGEVVFIEGRNLRSARYAPVPQPKVCSFEFVYFSRPDSHLNRRLVYAVRRRLGEILAEEQPAEADLVVGIPDSGTIAAVGYSAKSGIPLEIGFVKNRYIGRTFIQPYPLQRENEVEIKLNPLREVVAGRRLVVVDDSIVRGTTIRKIIAMLREAGAKEVHIRISSPPIQNPCYYGIDFPTYEELTAANLEVEEIRQKIGADTLGYLSVEGLHAAMELGETACNACFTGRYPIPVPQQLRLYAAKTILEGRETDP